jgi:DNA transformation protein and related proteins
MYGKEGRAVATSYGRLPDGALDDPSEAARWARLALDASRRKPARRRRARR